MLISSLSIFAIISFVEASNNGLQLLFPDSTKQYTYYMKTNISCGTLVPAVSDSYWTIEGKLLAQVYDGFSRVRYTLGDLETSIYGKNHGYASYDDVEASQYLTTSWEVDYLEDGNINYLFVTPDEPLWATNMKRALSINFQLKKDIGTYYNQEPCLYESYMDCRVVYVANGNVYRKYNALHILSENSGYTRWMSVPMDYSKAYFGPINVYNGPEEYSGPLDNIGTADRLYKLDDRRGLISLDLKSVFQHKTRSHVLAVTTELSLNYDSEEKIEKIEKIDLVKTSKRYVGHGYTDPTNGIRNHTQGFLRNKTYEILLRIASKGIDADNIVKNASRIHNLDFFNLLKTMSQLDYPALSKLFEDMVLGTSYDLETSRNIFLEVLPHVRTNACALFIKYLVLEQKQKIEDATILSLIRKLPFNVANHSQTLLEELEVFTRLGLDFSQEIRHAGILSFATLVFKTTETRRVKQDYFDNIIVKYFRMYSDCPQYIDRLVWLQGLSNIQYGTATYIWTIYNNATHNRHERYWAVQGTTPVYATGFAPTWHILMNEDEHIQLRIAALHAFLSSRTRPSELLSVHNYILNSKNDQLKRFWYTTVKSLENSKTYNGYRVASNYVSFLTNQVTNPTAGYWATGNYIVGSYDDETATGAMCQMMSIGHPITGLPVLLHFRVRTVSELIATGDLQVFIKAEGVATDLFEKYHGVSRELDVEALLQLLKKMKVQTVSPEEFHIEVVIKIHDKTVYATHFNQSRFDSNWNGEELSKTINDFLKFGSHINQQMVYYPFQLDASIPTELGTPVRLQTAIVSFSSIRGNLTAPHSSTTTWSHDIHIRYQGTAVTSLCTDGPLLRSEHVARVQQSLVAHLPLKFDIYFDISRLQVKMPNPVSLDAGLAMHARAQISMEYSHGNDTYTVNAIDKENTVDDSGVIFDCDRPVTASDIIERFLASNAANYDFLTKLRPSVLLLNAILLLSAPPSGSCGLLIGGKRSKMADTTLKLALVFDEQMSIEYSEIRPNGDVQINVSGTVKIHLSDDANNVTLHLDLTGSRLDDEKHWKFCLKSHDETLVTLDRDISASPPPYEGQLDISYGLNGSCPADGARVVVEYHGGRSEQVGGPERILEVHVSGQQIPTYDINETAVSSHPVLQQLVSSFEGDSLNVTAVIKEQNGQGTLSVNGRSMRFRADNFAWMLDSWTTVQVKKKIGLFRECRLQRSTVLTLDGLTESLPLVQCEQSLVLADCTDKPRFAVFRTKSGGINFYTKEFVLSVNRHKKGFLITINGEECDMDSNCKETKSDNLFQISHQADIVKVYSQYSGVYLYVTSEEIVILTPHAYLTSACGACAAQHYYNIC